MCIYRVIALLKFGGDINSRTSSNETTLHKAARWDRKEVAVYLLEKGARVDMRSNDHQFCYEL